MESEEALDDSSKLIRREGLRFKIDLKAARHKMADVGHINTVFFVSITACIASVLISALLWVFVFGRELEFAVIFISFFIPATLFPIGMWYMVGVTLDLHHLESEMRYLASYDVLTDVMTRRAFLSSCESLYVLMLRDNKPFALAYIDLDDFKSVNDSFGHAAGDEVLSTFAEVLRSVVRRSDLIGRIGGEEFALALPETDISGAIYILNQVRVLAKNTAVEYRGHKINFTISIGLSFCDSNYQQSLDEMIRQADQALYAAKSAGKDRVVEHHCVVETF